MSGDNLAVFLFLEGFAVTFFLEGRKEEGWRKYAFWLATLLLIVFGLAWPEIEKYWPEGTLEGRTIATNPESWLLLFLVVMIFISFSGIRKKLKTLSERKPQLPVAPIITKDESLSLAKPDLRINLFGGHVFVPDAPDVKDKLTGIHLDASVWNLGSPSVVTSWGLNVCPSGKTPVIAQFTRMPPQLNVGGPINSVTIRGSDSLQEKTSKNPVGSTPESGSLLFYVNLPKAAVLDTETRLELSASDIFNKETIFTQRMGDWLSR